MQTRCLLRITVKLISCFYLMACSVDISHQRLEEITLQPTQGLVVLGIQGNTPFQRIAISGTRMTDVGFEMLKNAKPFVVFTLPQGHYKFEKVWLNQQFYVPVSDKSDSGIWEFEVQPGYINYLGNIVVTEDSSDRYFLRMNNRSSEALEFLEAKYATKLTELRLRNAIAQSDDFFDYVSRQKGYPHD